MIKEYTQTFKTVYSRHDDVTLVVTDSDDALYEVVGYHFGSPDPTSIDFCITHPIDYPVYIKKEG